MVLEELHAVKVITCVSDSEAYPLSSVAIVLLEVSCLETLVMAFVVITEDKSCTQEKMTNSACLTLRLIRSRLR